MRVFSASIESFLQRLTVVVRQILRDEFRVSVGRTRFETADGWTWPIRLVAIDDAQRLGYFDPELCTIAVHKRTMYSAKDRVLENLLRHELAHYFTYIAYHESGLEDRAHGPQFQSICERYGLALEVRRSTCDIAEENDAIAGELENEATIARIRRLLSLAESDNEHEAALALLRANELMVRHNLDAAALPHVDAEEIEYCVKVVIPCRRSSPRTSAIADILTEFFVYPVQTTEGLEVTGTRANVEQAEYIAGVLDRALAASWKRTRSNHPGQRLREKPFMEAAAESYLAKLRRAKAQHSEKDQRALAILADELEWAGCGTQGGGVHTATSWYETCETSTAQGTRAGAELEIQRGLGIGGTVKLLDG
ncbi:MAG: DUF2786 domain-containing protein [Deltaproteobacteria bacterium]|nr:DUF2786 domain-containing protein [Deltaproteobacteria bacterium]MBW2389112.1 DUF2786 domain-containing protein [Deltaproteobacteria bacterium]